MEQNLKNSRELPGIRGILNQFGVGISMAVVLIVFQMFDSRFLNPRNVVGVLNTSTILIIMSLAMTMCMSVRGMDLSVAQMADLSGVVVAFLILSGMPPWLAVVIGIGCGLLVGMINGVVISYFGVPALIGTLGMMFIIRSIELSLTNGAQPQILFTLPAARVKNFFFIGQGAVGVFSMLVIICAILVIAAYIIKERSKFGRHMDALQDNVRAAFLCSIDIRKVFALTFVFSSVLAAISGIMLASRSGSAVPRGVESYLTECFVAVYLGTLLSKRGRFNVIGTVIGALFVGFLSNFFTLVGFSATFKSFFNGVFIILAVSLSALQKKKYG